MRKKFVVFIPILIFCLTLPCLLLGCNPKSFGNFYDLEEAYENKLLSKSDLEKIARFCNEFDNEVPESERPKLDEKVAKKVKESKAFVMNSLSGTKSVKTSDVKIDEYFGTYGKCVAVELSVKGFGKTLEFPKYTIDGVYFEGHRIEIWVENDK